MTTNTTSLYRRPDLRGPSSPIPPLSPPDGDRSLSRSSNRSGSGSLGHDNNILTPSLYPPQLQIQTPQHPPRPSSSASDSSSSSQLTSLAAVKRAHSPYGAQLPAFTSASNLANHNTSSSAAALAVHQQNSANSSNTSLPNFSRPAAIYMPNEPTAGRKASPLAPPLEMQKHRPRQHSQGFFEPSLPSTSLLKEGSNMAARDLTASAIAAQAAMQHQASGQHVRKRSQTVPSPQLSDGSTEGRRNSKQHSPDPPYAKLQQTQPKEKEHFPGYHNGLVGTNSASLAASAAFPRSGGGGGGGTPTTPISSTTNLELPGGFGDVGKDGKVKGEKSKMKLFSKPKHIGISRDKDAERKEKPMPSPSKVSFQAPSQLSKVYNASTTSLAESLASSGSSMYTLNNASSTTMIPMERIAGGEGKEGKEKSHKHHFLSRQKMKLKDKSDDHHLPLSSASSTSKPLDPNAPSLLYSFAPASPGGGGTSFAKSVSGLDLRHGGRALREKKREEKSNLSSSLEPALRDTDSVSEWGGTSNGPSNTGQIFLSSSSLPNDSHFPSHNLAIPNSTLQGFGLNNMSAEDAWDFLKAKLLVIFEGEEVRFAVEDLNRLVSIHIQRCVQKLAPSIIVEDLRDLLQTGFSSLNHAIRTVPDDKLVPHLVRIWLLVFGSILPFMQAVFLPLDLEFKGHGSIMSNREAQEFWGALPESEPRSLPSDHVGEELDVRRIVLVSFRDNVILPRYDALKATFSRLSLDSINADPSSTNLLSTTPNNSLDLVRPGTAASLDVNQLSYNSQTSTLLNSDSNGSRSRAISNVSNVSAPDVQFHSFSSPLSQSTSANSIRPTATAGNTINPVSGALPDSSQVTETVTRMLQCVSVLASVQTGGEEQERMERLSKELKLNWLGRGRTGRNRRGFVGTKVRVRSLRDGQDGSDQGENSGANDGETIGEAGVFGRSLL